MRRIADASAEILLPFVTETVEEASLVRTDGWSAYSGLRAKGYAHETIVLRGRGKNAAAELLPRVHLVVSLLKRWLLGTHQGSLRPEHLDYYLDEFTFRFNRRTSRHRGKLFYRLLQQAVAVDPLTYQSIVERNARQRLHNMLGSLESRG